MVVSLGRPATVSSSFVHMSRYTYLVVDEAPCLQELMHAHDSAHITTQISPARRESEILWRIETIRVDHKVSAVLIRLRRLAPVSAIKPLRQTLLLNPVDFRHVEPHAVAGQDNILRLLYEICARCGLNG